MGKLIFKMKKILLLFLVFVQVLAFGQDDVSANFARWEYGNDGYSLKNFRIDLENNTPYVITEVKIRVVIYDDESYYHENNAVHTFKVNIPAYELGSTPAIPLKNKRILRYWKSFSGLGWSGEILDVTYYKTPAQIQEEKEEAERIRLEEERIAREKAEAERILAEKLALEKKINETMLTANEYYTKNKLFEAKKYFSEVLVLNPNQQEAKRKFDEIQEFFKLRSGVGYVYRNERSTDFNSLKTQFAKVLNEDSQQYKEGKISMKVSVLFDTNGSNRSTITGIESSQLKSKLEAILKSTLGSTQKFGYFVNAHDEFPIEMQWNSEQELVISNGDGINGQGRNFASNNVEVKDYINKLAYKYGDFTFEFKNKTIKVDGAQTALTDMYFVHYKLNAGPKYAFYSLILPGWGSAKVSSGEHGFLTGFSYLIALSSAGLTKLMEKGDYQDYKDAETQYAAETAYTAANQDRKLFLISLGVVGFTYVYDFTWSVVKGFGNVKSAHAYKKELKQSPLLVKLSTI